MTTAPIERIPLSRIEVGARRRKALGGVAALAKSIEEHGLLHPIIVTEDNMLVAGERRLKACERLGMKSIPARRFERLSDDELRAIELDENAQRLDLDDYEKSRERLREIEAAEEEVSRIESAKPAANGGRPKGGNREVARRLGLDEGTIRKTKRHVSAGERYPVLQGKGWRRGAALDAAEQLDAMEPEASKAIAEMIAEPGVPPEKARKIIDNVASQPKAAQRQLAKLYESEDKEKQTLAKTRALKLPPQPPARLTWLRDSIRSAERCLGDGHTEGNADIRSAISSLKAGLKETEGTYKALRKREGF